jgi:hypothetical protein
MDINGSLSIEGYTNYFTNIVERKLIISPYDDEAFYHYTVLNYSRFNRWIKKGSIHEAHKAFMQSITEKISLIVISEPWCGDAAHIVPFCFKLAQENKNIAVRIQLRDSDSEIDNYLTGTSRSIPVIICRNEAGKDLFHWGPRPKACQQLADELKRVETPIEEVKIALQHWYNSDQGTSFVNEFVDLLKQHVHSKRA